MLRPNNKYYANAYDIQLLKGSLFDKSREIGLEYIKSIDVDRLLAPSYEMHNVMPPNNAVRYGGWERKKSNNWAPDGGSESYTLAGHSLGHWMSAAAAFYGSCADDELYHKLLYVVKKLGELQDVSGSDYIGGCPEDTFIKCFNGDPNWHKDYWVPWYGIHKIYQGLIDVYLCDDEILSGTAFKVLKRFVDWAVDGTVPLSDEFMQSVLDVEYGGMNEIFAFMYEFTGEKKYLDAAHRFTHDALLVPLENGIDSLSGMHANTQIPKIIGAAKIYEQASDKYVNYRKACENFYDFVINDRSYAIGGNSIAEHFEAKGFESLGIKTCESCNTYNMMRLTEYLFAWDHKSEYMDWYENALYNHILGQQDPDTGSKMYFVSLLPGHHRVYEVKRESWWCCTGTGMENPGRYTRVIYFEDNDSLYVNLYMPNVYNWRSRGIVFKTETNYPYSDKVRITVDRGNANAAIKLRVPQWCNDMRAKIGQDEYLPDDSGYINIRREWNEGDIIDITIPMGIRVYKSRTKGQIAYKYGPLILAADLGSVKGESGVEEYITNETRIDQVTTDVPYIVTNGDSLENIVKAVDKDRRIFCIPAEHSSSGKSIELKPFYELHHVFYSIYFNVDFAADAFIKALNDATIDMVEPDGQQDEIGHGMMTNTSGKSHYGSFADNGVRYMYRDTYGRTDDDADELPYFSYSLSVRPGKNYLCILYRVCDSIVKGGKTYKRDFEIYADEEKIGESSVDSDNTVKYVFYEIPERVTSGKDSITIKFRVRNSNSYAEALELRTTMRMVKK